MRIEQLKEKQKKIHQQVTDFYTPRGLHVYFKDQLTNDAINVEKVISFIESKLPDSLTSEVEMLIIWQFEEFEKHGFNAFYDSGTICVTNVQDDEQDMIDDIIHEYAHSLEEPHGLELYGDFKLKNEFLRKREALHNILWKSGFKAPKAFFVNVDYDKEFDDFLYKKVGYDKLTELCKGLFISPYSATSLREYFATGFTEFFMYPDEHDYLKKMGPTLYEKINNLYSKETVDNY